MANKSEKTYYFITVSYNGSNYTIKYLESVDKLIKQGYKVKIIVVDNASTIEDFKRIEAEVIKRKDVELIRNKENLGYFKALNVGILAVHDDQGVYIVGNNDIEFDEEFLSKLCEIVYEKDILVLAPNIITRDGFHQNPHCPKRLTKFRKAGYRIYFSNYYLGKLIYWITQKIKKPRSTQREDEWNHKRIIHMGIGACYVITENFFKYYNALDDRVFLWGEEALLAGQVSSAGGKILYDPGIIVHHNESGSVISIPSKKTYEITKESHRIYARYL